MEEQIKEILGLLVCITVSNILILFIQTYFFMKCKIEDDYEREENKKNKIKDEIKREMEKK